MKKRAVLIIWFGVMMVNLVLVVGCRPTPAVAALPQQSSAIYAMDRVDLKLFDAAAKAPFAAPDAIDPAVRKFEAAATAVRGQIYAMDPVDLKLLPVDGTSALPSLSGIDAADRKFF